jgi:hypothetical protein
MSKAASTRRFAGATAVLFAALVTLVLLVGTPTLVAAPSSFQLVFEGRHVPSTIATSSVMHVGTFTASAPFCASGTVADLEFQGGGQAVLRQYSCADASGSITVRSTFPNVEHETGSGEGALRHWKVLAGAGRYASLRGRGAWASVRLGGSDDPLEWATVTFRATATGVADLDAEAPQIAISRLTATSLRRPTGTYLVRVAFSARDNTPGNEVAYRLSVFNGRGAQLALKPGTTTSGTVSAALRVRPGISRVLRIEIVASDPLGNERTVNRTTRVRR